jgi:hypothetical protein
MELVLESDVYAPSMDEAGNYVDKIPSFHIIKKGLLCPCGSRKDKSYDTNSTFSAHIKTKTHQKWITSLNLNKINYYMENEKLVDTIQNQRLIIAKLEKDVGNKIMTIDYLTQQLNKNKMCVTVTDLIDF